MQHPLGLTYRIEDKKTLEKELGVFRAVKGIGKRTKT